MPGPRPADVNDGSTAVRLRAAMVEGLRELGDIRDPRVAAALSRVPRHLFAPDEPLEAAYALDRLVTRRDAHGMAVGSISAPQVQAMMLEQAGIERGMRCLEIGSGGYNAALMAELVGDGGEVTTLDIDPGVIDRAGRSLAAAGYPRVNLVLGDGEEGAPEHAPFDRVIVTAGAWDIPPAWIDQLAEDGAIVVPLRVRGLTRSVVLEREDDHLVVRSAKVCGFVPMRGAGAHAEHVLLLRGREIGLRFDEEWPGDANLLDGALDTPRAEAWSGVRIGLTKPFDLLELWLATVLDGFCLLSVDPDLDTGLVAPANRVACPAMASSGSFAYLAMRRGHHTAEFGAHAYGPDAARLAEELAEQVRVWDRDHRGGPGPRITIHPITARLTRPTGPRAGFYAAPHGDPATGPMTGPMTGPGIGPATGSGTGPGTGSAGGAHAASATGPGVAGRLHTAPHDAPLGGPAVGFADGPHATSHAAPHAAAHGDSVPGPVAGFTGGPHAGSGPGHRTGHFPVGSAVRLATGRLITKRHVHVAVSWPTPTLPAIGPRILRDPVGN
ncbi:methyltransferase, FxLD system [Thermopolyspora sp. NPDC052614]|uniref:methyltransferase, FxLD system n=1 Tax=Thermopolyspora sp. NPDC052614 TaxID=3155682 RepID=UPI00342D64E5